MSHNRFKIWIDLFKYKRVNNRGCAYKNIEITSWKVRAYGILTRVGEVSEIERVRFLIQNQRV